MRRLRPAVLLLAVGVSVLLAAPLGSWAGSSAARGEVTANVRASASCSLAGRWSQSTPGIGPSTWVIKAGGQADEQGLGGASGTATLSGSVLQITWTVTNWAGVYRWTLGKNCSGSGTLSFTAGPRAGQTFASTVTGPAPSATPETPKSCPVPPRLPASVDQDVLCRYRVHFQFGHGRSFDRPEQGYIGGGGVGNMIVSLPAKGISSTRSPTRGCAEPSYTLSSDHRHRQYNGRPSKDDINIWFKQNNRPDRDTKTCLEIRRRAGKVFAMAIDASVEVDLSNDKRCPVGTIGEIHIRAGEPFPYVILDICNHREIYTPPKSARRGQVNAKIFIRPA